MQLVADQCTHATTISPQFDTRRQRAAKNLQKKRTETHISTSKWREERRTHIRDEIVSNVNVLSECVREKATEKKEHRSDGERGREKGERTLQDGKLAKKMCSEEGP